MCTADVHVYVAMHGLDDLQVYTQVLYQEINPRVGETDLAASAAIVMRGVAASGRCTQWLLVSQLPS